MRGTFLRAFTGGDDYELLFTAPPDAAGAIADISRSTGVAITEIGEIRAGSGVGIITSDGRELPLEKAGFTHF